MAFGRVKKMLKSSLSSIKNQEKHFWKVMTTRRHLLLLPQMLNMLFSLLEWALAYSMTCQTYRDTISHKLQDFVFFF